MIKRPRSLKSLSFAALAALDKRVLAALGQEIDRLQAVDPEFKHALQLSLDIEDEQIRRWPAP